VSLLLVDVALVGGGILLGRWIMRRMRARSGDARAEAVVAKERPAPKRDPFGGLPCKLGDVLVRVAERDEAWLAGALVLEEERPVAVLFVAPEAGGDRAIFVRPPPPAEVVWLTPLKKGELALTADPPHSIEHAGARFRRVRRLPVTVSRLGSGAPAVGAQGIVAEYEGGGTERIVVLAAGQEMLAWRGVALGDGEYDVLPGDGSTLESV
jgi:hypothetical protein